MALQFINQNPGGLPISDRRIIRSHVMQGKNAGKKRPSNKKQAKLVELRRRLNAPGFGYTIPRQVLWGDLCLTSFPQELDSASMALLHRCMLSLLFDCRSYLLVSDFELQGFLTLAMYCFRRSSAPNLTL